MPSRVIDLSYTAAWKLGYVGNGSTQVEVESVLPGDVRRRRAGAAAACGTPTPIAPRSPTTAASRCRAEHRRCRTCRMRAAPILQLGAFGNRDNAESLPRAHLRANSATG